MVDKGKQRETDHSPTSGAGNPPALPARRARSGSSTHECIDQELSDGVLAGVPGSEKPSPPSYTCAGSSMDNLLLDTPPVVSQTKDLLRRETGDDDREPVDTEGRIQLSLNISKALPPIPSTGSSRTSGSEADVDFESTKVGQYADTCPALNIVIFIVGSRGDVQPYVALALGLIKSRGHRVRLATHGEFKSFVLKANEHLVGLVGPRGELLEGKLEFFDAGGDPRELMAYMVKRLMPGIGSIVNGDISAKRKMTAEYIKGFYKSTFFPDARNGPFAADAIISNPPAFAHIHVAQCLGIPLHMSFTMPWSPTQAFHHPLVNIVESNAEKGMTNQLSFRMADIMMWQGLGDLINNFRHNVLGLRRLTVRNGPSLTNRRAIPWTYCWSDSLIPKPHDWKSQIDIAGFYFLQGSSSFEPEKDLAAFLNSGPPPMYIGFGSVPVKDPAAMTSSCSKTIFDAVQMAGVRALVSAGWGGLGGVETPPEVFVLRGNIPHDWLFANGRVSAVCHHGGAGTTAIGLYNGLPTIVVPFFGDQQFWGDMISNAGAGPVPIKPKQLNATVLAEAIAFAYSEPARTAAQKMGEVIRSEDGVGRGVASFHKHLPLNEMRCQVDPSRVAYWWSAKYCLRLSGAVAATLHERGLIDMGKLVPHRSQQYEFDKHNSDPGTGAVRGVAHVVTTSFSGAADLFYNPARGVLALTWGVTHATFGIIYDIWEGMDNIPSLMRSDTRARGKITGVTSGFAEAGLGLVFGIWDGVAGLVTEPYVGMKRGGGKGAALGAGKSLVNLVMRPASGILGLIVLPSHGLATNVRSALRASPGQVYQSPRYNMSMAEAAKLSIPEKDEIVRQFETHKEETKARKWEYRKPRFRPLLTGQLVPRSHKLKDKDELE